MWNLMSFAPILWLVLVIGLVLLEAVTYQLVSIWLALGAAVALIASLFHVSGTVQIVIFIVVSAISLIASRPLVKKVQSAPKAKTNSDRIIGQTAQVLQPISSEQKGRVSVDGRDWSAAVQNPGEQFAPGDEVQIVRIEGVTVYVQKQS